MIEFVSLDNNVTAIYKVAEHYKVSSHEVVVTDEPTEIEFAGVYYTTVGKYLKTHQNLNDISGKFDDDDILVAKLNEYADKHNIDLEDVEHATGVKITKYINNEISDKSINYHNYNAIKEKYDFRNDTYKLAKRDDAIFLNKYDKVSEKVSEIDELDSEITLKNKLLTNKRFTFQPDSPFPHSPVDHGLCIFDSAITSEYTPYVQYNGVRSNEIYIKSYDPVDTKYAARLSVLYKSLKLVKRSTIYAIVWVGNPKFADLSTSGDILFQIIEYNLTNNRFVVGEPHQKSLVSRKFVDVETLFGRVKQLFPVLTFGEPEPSYTVGTMIFNNLEYSEPDFLNAVLNDRVLASFIHSIDNGKILAKPSFAFDLFEGNTTKWHFKAQNFVNTTAVVFTMERQTNSVKITVKSSYNTESVDSFASILALLFTYYSTVETDEYSKYDDINDLTLVLNTNKESNLDILKREMPDVFDEPYGRKCQDNRPIIIDKEDIEYWENIQIKNQKRSILEYPYHENTTKYLVCPDDRFPYPAYLEGSNINGLRYPCCQSSKPNLEKQVATGSKKTIATKAFLPVGQQGSLPSDIVQVLSGAGYNGLNRLGVVTDRNSLIHSILTALKVKKYMKLANPGKIRYCNEVRKEIADTMSLELYRQEMYNYTSQQIDQVLESGFYDPYLVYRGLEEHFDINIYTFRNKRYTNKYITEFELPRHKIFHTRPIRKYRPCVLIYKTDGTDEDTILDPQCELIIDEDGDGLFGKEMVKYLHNIIIPGSKETYMWTIENGSLYGNVNVQLYTDFLQLFQLEPLYQCIDKVGKMRGIIVKLPNGTNFTIFVHPSQPENLKSKDFTTHPKLDIKEALKIFGEPEEWSVVNDNITGLWFKNLGIRMGVFVPTIGGHKLPKNAEITNFTAPVSPEDDEISNRVLKLRRDVEIIKEIAIWVYSLSGLSMRDFIAKYLRNDEYEGDSSKYYSFNIFPSLFPVVKNVEKALEYIKLRKTGLVVKNKIVCYTELFRTKLAEFLFAYDRTHKGEIPKNLKSYFLTFRDFQQHPSSNVFTSKQEMNNWLDSKITDYEVITSFDEKYAIQQEPFFFKNKDGHIYIIQNNPGNNFESAIHISKSWTKYKINELVETDKLPKYEVHVLTKYGTIEVYKETEHASKILYYGTREQYEDKNVYGLYGSLLQLI